jgi:hypothetical protein
MKSQKATFTPRFLQLLVVWTVLGATAIDLLMWIGRAVMQASSNPNFSGFFSIFMFHLMMLVVFAGAFALVSRKVTLLQRIFESTLVLLATQALYGVLSNLLYTTSYALRAPVYDTAFLWGRFTEVALAIVTLGVIFSCLLVARHKKLW